MTVKIQACEQCGEEVAVCDNAAWLDFPAVPYDEAMAQWTIMRLGAQHLASVGGPSPDGTGHALHVHQPDDSVMA